MLKTVTELEYASYKIKKNLFNLARKQSIHIGGDLSIVDVMTVLWQYQMKYQPQNPQDPTRDRFVLSKGHASAVTSFNQAAIGCFDEQEIFDEYASDTGRFSMHSCNLINPYVEVSTGSLGHGFPIACGIATGLRLNNNFNSRVYVVMGDGEHAEGSIWEAIFNATHYKLGNLVAIVDFNGLEADGTIDEITSLGDLSEKYRVSGWNVIEIDGHDLCSIKNAFDQLPSPSSTQPSVLICHTVKGHGVSFMENQVRWHAGKLNDEQYEIAINELEKQYAATKDLNNEY